MLDLSRIDLESISCNQTRSSFSEIDLEEIAEGILQSGGLVKPVTLKKVGFDQYELVDGYLEYYAAVKAFEKDADQSEVNAVVILSEDTNIVEAQIQRIKALQSPTMITQTSPSTNLESRLANIELRLEKQVNELKSEQSQERQKFERKFEELEKRLPKPIAPIEALNTFNLAELTAKLSSVIGGKTGVKIAASIFNEREENSAFKSCADVVNRVKGLGDKRMIKIIDSFSII